MDVLVMRRFARNQQQGKVTMCHCDPNIRTPNCGKLDCFPNTPTTCDICDEKKALFSMTAREKLLDSEGHEIEKGTTVMCCSECACELIQTHEPAQAV